MSIITLGDFLHNYPERILDATIDQLVAANSTCNSHHNNFQFSTFSHHRSGGYDDDRTTRPINSTRIIPYTETDSEAAAAQPIGSYYFMQQSAESNVFQSEENYLDDYRANNYSIASTASSCINSSLDNSTMPVKSYFSSMQSFEDLSILSDDEEDDWMYLILQDGLRMVDNESREWMLEHVDFVQQAQNVEQEKKDKKSTSQLDKINVSIDLKNLRDNINWNECKYTTNDSTFAKSAGSLHYYKPAQPITKKAKNKLRKGLMDIVSSENFGMASMLVCPPLIFAHWYAVYQKQSIELNSAQYFESEWLFNNREQYLERVAVLKSYPKAIQKKIKNYTQEELDAHFPKKIVSKRIAYDYIRKHGFTFEKVESKSGATTYTLVCGSEILIEFISSFHFCSNLTKLFTLMSVSFISRTMALSVNILCEQLRRVNEETASCDDLLQSSPDGEAILYHNHLVYTTE